MKPNMTGKSIKTKSNNKMCAVGKYKNLWPNDGKGK